MEERAVPIFSALSYLSSWDMTALCREVAWSPLEASKQYRCPSLLDGGNQGCKAPGWRKNLMVLITFLLALIVAAGQGAVPVSQQSFGCSLSAL